MIDINLLPPEYGPKKLISLFNVIGILIFSLICLSMIFTSLRLLASIQDYSSRVEYHDEQIKIYKQQVEDIRELGEKVNLLKARLSVVRELLQERTTWSDRLSELVYYLPHEGIWIDGLTVEREKAVRGAVAGEVKGEPIVARISGGTVSVDKVSQFIGNLEESNTFGNVVFDSAATPGSTRGSLRTASDPFMSFRFKVEVLTRNRE